MDESKPDFLSSTIQSVTPGTERTLGTHILSSLASSSSTEASSQQQVATSTSTPNDSPPVPQHYSSSRSLNEANSSRLISSMVGPTSHGSLPPGYPRDVATVQLHQRMLRAEDEARLLQQQAYRRIVLDHLIHNAERVPMPIQNHSALSLVVPSAMDFARGMDGPFPGSRRLTADDADGTASVDTVRIEGGRLFPSLPLSSGVASRPPTAPTQEKKKRKRNHDADTAPTDELGGGASDTGAVGYRDTGTVNTLPTTGKAPAAASKNTPHDVALASTVASSLLSHEFLRERSFFPSHETPFRPSLGMYGPGAFQSSLPLRGASNHALQTILPPSFLGISNAALAQHLSLAVPSYAPFSTSSYACSPHVAMMNSDHLRASINLAGSARDNIQAPRAGDQPRHFSDGSMTQDQSQQISATTGKDKAKAGNQDCGRTFPLHNDDDPNNISMYQCFIRRQIEVFEATAKEAGTNAQGRNRPILPGQVGIRCRHCGTLDPKERATGAVYFPNRLDGVYQTAQKMASTHIFGRCKSIGPETREKLLELKLAAKSSDGGGKRYWSETLQRMGVEETESAGLVLNVTVADSNR